MFRAELFEHEPGDPASWHFLRLPVEVAEDVLLEAGPPQGFGSVRVEARIGASTWHTSLFPEAASGTLLLPVRKPVRRAEDLHAGAACEVGVRVAARA